MVKTTRFGRQIKKPTTGLQSCIGKVRRKLRVGDVIETEFDGGTFLADIVAVDKQLHPDQPFLLRYRADGATYWAELTEEISEEQWAVGNITKQIVIEEDSETEEEPMSPWQMLLAAIV